MSIPGIHRFHIEEVSQSRIEKIEPEGYKGYSVLMYLWAFKAAKFCNKYDIPSKESVDSFREDARICRKLDECRHVCELLGRDLKGGSLLPRASQIFGRIYGYDFKDSARIETRSVFYACKKGKNTEGILQMEDPKSTKETLRIEALVTNPENIIEANRNPGVGTDLMNEALAEAKRHHKEAVVVNVISEGRESFYRKFGFQKGENGDMIKLLASYPCFDTQYAKESPW